MWVICISNDPSLSWFPPKKATCILPLDQHHHLHLALLPSRVSHSPCTPLLQATSTAPTRAVRICCTASLRGCLYLDVLTSLSRTCTRLVLRGLLLLRLWWFVGLPTTLPRTPIDIVGCRLTASKIVYKATWSRDQRALISSYGRHGPVRVCLRFACIFINPCCSSPACLPMGY